MSKLIYKNKCVYAIDSAGNKVEFLNANNLLENKSKLPMHVLLKDGSIDMTHKKTVFGFVVNLINSLKNEFNINDNELIDIIFIFDLFMANQLIKTSLPLTACEFGCDENLISINISEMLGKFNSESNFCVVNNSPENNPNNELIEILSNRENKPKLSIHFSDNENTCLEKHSFDIIIINGFSDFTNINNITEEAKRLIKDGGTVLCISYNNDTLYSTFMDSFSNCLEFNFKDNISIIKASYNKKNDTKKYDLMSEIDSLTADLKSDINYEKNLTSKKINYYLKEIKRLTKTAAEKEDIKNKIFLIDLIESLIDYKICRDPDTKNIYRSKILRLL